MPKYGEIKGTGPAPFWCETCKMELAEGQVAYHRHFGHHVVKAQGR